MTALTKTRSAVGLEDLELETRVNYAHYVMLSKSLNELSKLDMKRQETIRTLAYLLEFLRVIFNADTKHKETLSELKKAKLGNKNDTTGSFRNNINNGGGGLNETIFQRKYNQLQIQFNMIKSEMKSLEKSNIELKNRLSKSLKATSGISFQKTSFSTTPYLNKISTISSKDILADLSSSKIDLTPKKRLTMIDTSSPVSNRKHLLHLFDEDDDDKNSKEEFSFTRRSKVPGGLLEDFKEQIKTTGRDKVKLKRRLVNNNPFDDPELSPSFKKVKSLISPRHSIKSSMAPPRQPPIPRPLKRSN